MGLHLLYVAAGGAAGAVLRFLVGRSIQSSIPGAFPVGTLSVNILGCFLIGVLAGLFAGPTGAREELRLGLVVGLLGGFTTFSSFGFETLALLDAGNFRAASTYVLASNLVGVGAAWLGARLTSLAVS